MALQKGTMPLLWYAQAESLEILQNNLTPRETWVLALFLERGVFAGKFYTALISSCWDLYFFCCLKKKSQKQLRPMWNQECELLHCWEHLYPATSAAQPQGCWLVTVYQRELFARLLVFIDLPQIQPKSPHHSGSEWSGELQRWKCLKCKCARTPGQPPHPPGKCLNTVGPGGEC